MIQTVIVAGLAGTRLIRAWLYEDIGEPFRDPLEEWSEKTAFHPLEHADGTVEIVVTESQHMLIVKSWLNGLITCPHCLGFWATVGCVLALRFRVTRPLVLGLAGATILSAFADHYPGFNPEEGDDG